MQSVVAASSSWARLARRLLALAWLSCALAGAAGAQLTIGLATELRSVDPHRAATAAEQTLAAHVYEPLVRLDARGAPAPGLATGWTQLDETTWRFALRPGVRFHDGSPLTAADAVASIRRALALRSERGGRGDWLTVDAIDRAALRLQSKAAYAVVMQTLAGIGIASAGSLRAAEGGAPAPTLVGTGPYRIVRQGADGVVLAPSPRRGGKAAGWTSVALRPLTDAKERVAALRAGTIDAAERVPPADADALRADARYAVRLARSGRLMYLQLGGARTSAADVSVGDGAKAGANPLLEQRVRRAVSEAIDRRALAVLALGSLGEAAGQLVPPGFYGHVPGLEPDRHNLEDARALLAEAGYPNGFGLVLRGPKDVYPGDAAVLAAIARMLGEAGIRAEAIAEPAATFASRGSRQQYAAYLRGFAGATPDASEALVALLATHDPATGAGSLNWSRYSNGTLDGMLQRAITQPRDDGRELLLQEATRLALADAALLPLYFANDAWALRPGLDIAPRAGPYAVADAIAPRKAKGRPPS